MATLSRDCGVNSSNHCQMQGSPGIAEITRGRFFFFKAGQKQTCQEYSEKNIYRFGIYYKNIVYSSMPG